MAISVNKNYILIEPFQGSVCRCLFPVGCTNGYYYLTPLEFFIVVLCYTPSSHRRGGGAFFHRQ